MRALLHPVIVRELGVVLLKPGKELLSLFGSGRVLIERQPASMSGYQTGRVPDGRERRSLSCVVLCFPRLPASLRRCGTRNAAYQRRQ